METIDVLARGFVVKWVQVPDNSTVIFQAKPLKRSINLAVYRSNESRQTADLEQLLHQDSSSSHLKRSNSSRSLSLEERISKSDLTQIATYGQIDRNALYKSELKVEKGGIYAFIFDNTFSKNYSKKVLFNKFFVSQDSNLENRQQLVSNSTASLNSTAHHHNLHPAKGQYLQGYLLKKKRKKLQGYTKRFFILNFKYNTLSYYLNENSLKTRGEMQINISTISASKEEHSIVIDSGMDIWMLKTLNTDDWNNWINAFDFIKLNGIAQVDNSPISSPEFPPSQPKRSPEDNDVDLFNIYQQLNSLPSQLNHGENIETVQCELVDIKNRVKSLIKNQSNFNLKSPPASVFSQDYFDAVESESIDDHVLLIQPAGKGHSTFSVDDLSDDDSISSAKLQSNEISEEKTDEDDDYYPLPITTSLKRRNDISSSTCQPPSLFSFLRKNIGKDLSTISMPVTSNEPLTILQRITEGFEFANLLNEAAHEINQDLKFLKISLFAVSCLSSFRSKERNLRKPFNPILGETFEYVSDQHNYRLIGEKICHKPQMFAFSVESPDWEVSLTLNPEQKFWGKSIEIINKGSIKLVLKRTSEIFKWSQPSTVLKNIISGDRYSEPANSTLVITSSTGLKSTVEFKRQNSGGLFSSQQRSEDVHIIVTNSNNHNIKSDYYCQGKWTDSIYLKNFKNPAVNEKIWGGSKLLPLEESKWGFTEFASNLNEITPIEKGFIPFTDSRNRPDLRNYENGNVASAETLKLQLEQRQREERQRLADANKSYKPSFFKKINDLEYEFIKTKGVNYWDRRKVHNWNDIPELW